jgi:hypothetical protein
MRWIDIDSKSKPDSGQRVLLCVDDGVRMQNGDAVCRYVAASYMGDGRFVTADCRLLNKADIAAWTPIVEFRTDWNGDD